MEYKIDDYYKAIDEIASFNTAESWDNVGLLVGSRNTKVKSALLALDVTSEVLDEAGILGANLIITHHPVIFPSISRVDGDSLLHRIIAANIGIICAHTNYDTAKGGVNDSLCEYLGLNNIQVLESAENPALGRLGDLKSPMDSDNFAAFIKERLNVGRIKYTAGGPIFTVAVAGGSGSALWRDAFEQKAHALVTSEVKHSHLLEAAEAKFTLIDAGHYETEVVAMRPLSENLSLMLPESSIFISQAQKNPAHYL